MWRSSVRRHRVAWALTTLALSACSTSTSAGIAGTGAPTTSTSKYATAPTGPPDQPPAPAGSGPQAAPSRPSDLTRQAAEQFVGPPPVVTAPLPGPATALGMDYADPLAVARGYLAVRLAYRFDDPAGYIGALTAPAFTTAAFAARSAPSPAALTRLATSRETSAVQVAGAELEGEAPNSVSTLYVAVTGTATTTYRGGADTTPAAWTLRLVLDPAGQWRVDGVLSTD